MLLDFRGPLPYPGASASCVASGPGFRGHRSSGSLAGGCLAPLGWLVGVLCADGSRMIASQSEAPIVAICPARARVRVRRMDSARALI